MGAVPPSPTFPQVRAARNEKESNPVDEEIIRLTCSGTDATRPTRRPARVRLRYGRTREGLPPDPDRGLQRHLARQPQPGKMACVTESAARRRSASKTELAL